MKIYGTVIISVISAEVLRFMNHIIRRVNSYKDSKSDRTVCI